MSDQRFLGACILIASVIISISISLHSRAHRYQLVSTPGQIYVQDTLSGDTYQGWKQLIK